MEQPKKKHQLSKYILFFYLRKKLLKFRRCLLRGTCFKGRSKICEVSINSRASRKKGTRGRSGRNPDRLVVETTDEPAVSAASAPYPATPPRITPPVAVGYRPTAAGSRADSRARPRTPVQGGKEGRHGPHRRAEVALTACRTYCTLV